MLKHKNRLSNWANTWKLKFNVKKCTVIRCRRSLTPLIHDCIATYVYITLQIIISDEHIYLRVIIHKSLPCSWSSHISNIVAKASRTLTFLKRNLNKCLSQVKESTYLTMVRPQLEYASDVWNTHYHIAM